MPKKKDLKGMKFARLTVMYEAEPHYTSGGNKMIMWHCKCDCGVEKDIYATSLLNGTSKSCGCYNLEMTHKTKNKKCNEYDLSGDYGIGYDSKGKEFWFDLEDYDKIKDYCWCIHHSKYVCSHDKNHNWILLHKLIMNDLENKYDVDHIKTENKFDNRKSNLRIASRVENGRNQVVHKNNKSGVPGVIWHSRDSIWEAHIKINYKDIYLGRFSDFNEAVKARKEAEEKYFGKWSYDNSQKIAKKQNDNY